MNGPNWIYQIEVEALHRAMIEAAIRARGMRDAALLDSALARPLNQYAYGETNLFQLAVSYAEAIARNHPFVDSSKRRTFGTAINFLMMSEFP